MLLGTWVQERKGPVRGLESRSGRRAQAGGAAGAGWGLAGGRLVTELWVEFIPGFSAGQWSDLSCVMRALCVCGIQG